MNDPEFKEMVNKAIFITAIVLVFAIPVFFIYKNKIMYTKSELLKDIENKKTMMLYITELDCKKCEKYKKELDKKEIEYKELNRNTETDYNAITMQLGIDGSNISLPSLVYIEDGSVVSYIIDIKSKKSLNEYLENYK